MQHPRRDRVGLAISSAWWILWAYPPEDAKSAQAWKQQQADGRIAGSRCDGFMQTSFPSGMPPFAPARRIYLCAKVPVMRKGPCLAIRRKMVQRRSQEYRFGLCAEAAGDSRSPFEASRSADTARRWSKCTLPVEQGRKSMECAVSELARRRFVRSGVHLEIQSSSSWSNAMIGNVVIVLVFAVPVVLLVAGIVDYIRN